MAKHLTARQKEVLEFINEYLSERQESPAYREIAEKIGVKSLATIALHVKALERKGFLQRVPGFRGLNVLRASEDKDTIKIPIRGTTAGGSPLLAQENIQGYETVSPGSFGYTPDFLLAVKGDSMTEAGINNGDLVAIKRGINIQNGDIVVFMIEEESTVKRFYREGGSIILKPANSNYPNIVIKDDGKYLAPVGKVVGVIKKQKKELA